MFSRKVVVSMVALALFGGVGCGNKTNPAPPPPPQVANPAGGGFLGGGGGSCGGVSGQPINNGVPFSATLSGGYTTGNSIQLTLANPVTGGGYGYTSALVGNAQVTLPDLQQMFSTYIQSYSFCASSQDPSTGALTQGSLTSGTYVSLSMSGIMQVPSQSYAPYGYPGTQTMQPLPVYVDVGTSCQAYIQNNRLSGCVLISFGSRGSNQIYYQADGQGGGSYYGNGYSGGSYDPYYGGYGYNGLY